MKTLGIIGGMGPQASSTFLDLVIDRCISTFGAKDSADFPRIVLSNVPAPDLLSDRSRESQARAMLRSEVAQLKLAGADVFVMTCNTMHIIADEIADHTDHFISIIETVVQAVQQKGIRQIGLLGSETSMTSDLFSHPFNEAGIALLIPDQADRRQVLQCIKNVIAGSFVSSDREVLEAVILRLKDQGAQAVVLGCTELPLVVSESNSALPVSIRCSY